MISKLINIYLEINYRLFAYGIGCFLLAFSYPTSLLIPPLKRMYIEYERVGSGRSIFWLSFIGVITMMLLFLVLERAFINDHIFGLKYYILSFFIWMVGGCFALHLLADYRCKSDRKTSVKES